MRNLLASIALLLLASSASAIAYRVDDYSGPGANAPGCYAITREGVDYKVNDEPTATGCTMAGGGAAAAHWCECVGGVWTFTPRGAATALIETSGPTTLAMGAVNDGDRLVRSGSIITGTTFVGNALSHYECADDMMYSTNIFLTSGAPAGWTTGVQLGQCAENFAANGTGTSISTTTGLANHPGIITASTGTTTTGIAGALSAGSTVLFGSGAWTNDTVVRVPTLSDGTNRFTVRVGFLDTSAGESTDGAFLRYADNVNSGKWQCVARSNSVETATDTGVAAVAGTWYTLKTTVNAAGTLVTCDVNGTAVTASSNIPTSTGRETGQGGALIFKSLGTTARTLDIDLIAVSFTETTSR